jgi:hypothetical protein
LNSQLDLNELSKTIRELRGTAENLLKAGGDIEAIKRNVTKILANVKMLELNISDVADLTNG